MKILGISALFMTAVAIIDEKNILSAVQEERFSRIKHDPSFPNMSIEFCLKQNNLSAKDLDYVIFYDKPLLKFERFGNILSICSKGFKSFKAAIPIWLREKLYLKDLIIKELNNLDSNINWYDKLKFSDHHLSHAASAFYPSPFKNSAIITLDGVGEWSTTSISIGNNFNINKIREINLPHSLGLLYSAFTYFTGFKVNSGEYKMMG